MLEMHSFDSIHLHNIFWFSSIFSSIFHLVQNSKQILRYPFCSKWSKGQTAIPLGLTTPLAPGARDASYANCPLLTYMVLCKDWLHKLWMRLILLEIESSRAVFKSQKWSKSNRPPQCLPPKNLTNQNLKFWRKGWSYEIWRKLIRLKIKSYSCFFKKQKGSDGNQPPLYTLPPQIHPTKILRSFF